MSFNYEEKKDLKGTRTANNLLKSFLGEAHATLKYNYYASQAKEDGYVQIRDIFEETARNEEQHAKEFFRYLTNNGYNKSELKVEDMYSVGVTLGHTLDNLKTALDGERTEMADLYPEFSKIAEEEGFPKIAKSYQEISEVEEAHATRFEKLIENIENDKVFKRDGVVRWKCLNCGYIHEGQAAPDDCPACHHPIDHFELFVENY